MLNGLVSGGRVVVSVVPIEGAVSAVPVEGVARILPPPEVLLVSEPLPLVPPPEPPLPPPPPLVAGEIVACAWVVAESDEESPDTLSAAS